MSRYVPPELIGSRVWDEQPEIRIKFKRGRERISWFQTRHYLACGLRDSGKSALGEAVCCRHNQIIDLFGSGDNEGLAWLRSGIDDALLVVGQNVDLDSSWKVKRYTDLTFSELNSPEVVITVPSFFSTEQDYYKALEYITGLFKKRLSFNPRRPSIINIREAANFTYSRIAKGESNKIAKAAFIRFQREMRHFGYSLFVDTIRWTAIDKEMRDLADYTFFKDLGWIGLGSDVRFIYGKINPASIAGLSPDRFVYLSRSGSIGIGDFDYPPFHKEAGEDMLAIFEMSLEYGEEIEDSTSQRVGDKEHASFIDSYHDGGLSIRKINGITGRSFSTISEHIKEHNQQIGLRGECDFCRRAGSEWFKTRVTIRGR